MGTWAYDDHINVHEMRAVVAVIRHLARSSRNWNSRVLVLCDSMVTVGAVTKMRSSSFSLLKQLRKITALALCTGIRLTLRWIPTWMNPADGPSRGEAVGLGAVTEAKGKPDFTIRFVNRFPNVLSDETFNEELHADYARRWHL